MIRLVLLGGGHAHLFVLEALARNRMHDVHALLITPTRLAPYSGMMPGVVAGRFRYEDACIDLAPLAAAAGADIHYARAAALDPRARRVHCDDGSAFGYDLLSIDTGSAPPTGQVAGAATHAVPVKPIDRFIASFREFSARCGPAPRIALVGGGAAAVELAIAMQDALAAAGRQGRYTLIGENPTLMPAFARGASLCARRILAARRIETVLGRAAVGVSADAVELADGHRIASDFTVWATGSGAPDWPKAAGLETDGRGFILVDETMRSLSHRDIFAAGDVATIAGHDRPKAGVYAVRAGPPLAANLIAAIAGGRLRPYVPQRWALALLATGARRAIGARGPFAWHGAWAGRWKDRIDLAFIRRFTLAESPQAGNTAPSRAP